MSSDIFARENRVVIQGEMIRKQYIHSAISKDCPDDKFDACRSIDRHQLNQIVD